MWNLQNLGTSIISGCLGVYKKKRWGESESQVSGRNTEWGELTFTQVGTLNRKCPWVGGCSESCDPCVACSRSNCGTVTAASVGHFPPPGNVPVHRLELNYYLSSSSLQPYGLAGYHWSQKATEKSCEKLSNFSFLRGGVEHGASRFSSKTSGKKPRKPSFPHTSFMTPGGTKEGPFRSTGFVQLPTHPTPPGTHTLSGTRCPYRPRPHGAPCPFHSASRGLTRAGGTRTKTTPGPRGRRATDPTSRIVLETRRPRPEAAPDSSAAASRLRPGLAAPAHPRRPLPPPRAPPSRTAAAPPGSPHLAHFRVQPARNGTQRGSCAGAGRRPAPETTVPASPARRHRPPSAQAPPRASCLRDRRQAARRAGRPPSRGQTNGPARSAGCSPAESWSFRFPWKKYSGRTGSRRHAPPMSGEGFHPGIARGTPPRPCVSLHL